MWWIPAFQVKLSYGSIIQLSWNNINYLIWNSKRLIKLLTDLKHSFHFIVALIWMTNYKLFYFFKLVNSKKSMNIFSMSTCLFSKTRWISTHFDWQLFRLKYLTFVISSKSLLACGNQVWELTFKFVHVVFDSLKLTVFFQYVFKDYHWRLIKTVSLWLQKLYSVIC